MTALARLLETDHVFGKHAAVQHVDDTAGVVGVARVVRDHDDRHPFVTIQPLQQIHDVFSSLIIEISSWLIREKERRIADQGAGDRGSLHFPAGKFARFVIQTVTESDQFQQHTRAFDVLASVEQVSKCTG